MVMTFNIVPPTYFVYFLYHESRHIQTFLNHFIKLFQLSLLYHVQAFHTSRNCKEVHQNKRSQPSPHRVSKYYAKRHKHKQHGVICLILQTPESVAPPPLQSEQVLGKTPSTAK